MMWAMHLGTTSSLWMGVLSASGHTSGVSTRGRNTFLRHRSMKRAGSDSVTVTWRCSRILLSR